MKIKSKFVFLIVLFFIVVITFNSQAASQNTIAEIINAYRYYKDVDYMDISVPAVIEAPFADEFLERYDFAVFDKNLNSFEPHYFKQEALINKIPLSITSSPGSSAARMLDDNIKTYADFPLPENTSGSASITLSAAQPITSSALTVLLDNNVALPTSIEIRALAGGQNRIVVANKKMTGQTINFPKTTSNQWIIKFAYSQPLRISELRLNQDNAEKSSLRAVRFLAQPGHHYRIYYDPDRYAAPPVPESGNLATAKDVLTTSTGLKQNNPDYIIADSDKDGVPDIRDNCVTLANPDQEDLNNNNRGDLCDDFDQDGIINSKDNCPNNPNRNQLDTDGDKIGDVCDREESRFTEKHAWTPWAGIGFAALVLFTLFALTAKQAPPADTNVNPDDSSESKN